MREFPGIALFVTTMTPTGREAAARVFPGARGCALAPLDYPAAVRRFMGAVGPQLVLIAEAELWPNLLTEPHRSDARIAIVNARISERSLRRYRLTGSLIAGALASVDLILAQTEADADRFATLGANRDRIAVVGNTKFDLDQISPAAPMRPELESALAGRRLFVAGSTAPGEESVVLDAYRTMRERFPELLLVLAPRHLDRGSEVEDLLHRFDLVYVRASGLAAPNDAAHPAANPAVLLLDTLGELRAIYSRATVAFVGGSLVDGRGGQNLGEPAAAAMPVLFGPFHQKQIPMAQALLETGGGQIVSNGEQMIAAASALLADEPARQQRGHRARAAFQSLGGAVERSLMRLRPLISL
jgi:3-deoxy-D-manno-octulosonic-acid transferase